MSSLLNIKSNTWLLFAVAVWQRTSETLHLPQLHLYRSATSWFMFAIWELFMCYMCSSSISYMLTAACCGCILSSKSRCLLCRSSSVADLSKVKFIICTQYIHYSVFAVIQLITIYKNMKSSKFNKKLLCNV